MVADWALRAMTEAGRRSSSGNEGHEASRWYTLVWYSDYMERDGQSLMQAGGFIDTCVAPGIAAAIMFLGLLLALHNKWL